MVCRAVVDVLTLRVLDLFSGIGGFSLGLERTGGFETAAFCECEAFPRAVLAKHWPDVPCFLDVRELKGSDIDGPIDVICGGYPCQPFSAAGKRRGKADDRHLWPEFNRLVDELRPTWIIGENVAGHISMGLDDVLLDLERQGYACRTFVIPACAVDAPHRRDRVWTIAHSQGNGRQVGRRSDERRHVVEASQQQFWPEPSGTCPNGSAEFVAHAAVKGFSDGKRAGKSTHESEKCAGMVAQSERRGADVANAAIKRQQRQGKLVIASYRAAQIKRKADNAVAISEPRKWRTEPDVGRVANGVPRRVDRLKALGNAVVPQVVEMIGHAILEAHNDA